MSKATQQQTIKLSSRTSSASASRRVVSISHEATVAAAHADLRESLHDFFCDCGEKSLAYLRHEITCPYACFFAWHNARYKFTTIERADYLQFLRRLYTTKTLDPGRAATINEMISAI